jgi:FMN reductase
MTTWTGRMTTGAAPFIVGIGGTMRAGSSSERALVTALRAAEKRGAVTYLYSAAQLDFPMYAPGVAERTPAAREFVAGIARADGLILASPGYHGSISGLVKNAIDYIEDLRDGPRVYLDGMAVGCIACAQGWQATATTLASLRSVVHALRGWPTPLGVAINSAQQKLNAEGEFTDENVIDQLELLGNHVADFAEMRLLIGDHNAKNHAVNC